MWRDLTRKRDAEIRLPEVDGERCVHALLEQASCRACVEGCPRRAWVMDDEMLGIDPELCDGCGLCAPLCPQGAIQQLFSPMVEKGVGGAVAFARCEYTDVTARDKGLMPCLHVIGLTDLLRLHREGVRHLVTCSGDCGRCGRGGVKPLGQWLEEVNRLLTERGLTTISQRELDAARWSEAVRRLNEMEETRTLDRRAFFRRALEAPAQRLEQVINGLPDAFTPPGALLPRTAPNDRLPFVPRIVAASCSGCDACVRLCPQGAIVFDAESDPPAYRIFPEQCSGCGICSDVCGHAAVTVQQWSLVAVESISLRTEPCRACGVPFHLSAEAPVGKGFCPVCVKANHHKNLYQVIDG